MAFYNLGLLYDPHLLCDTTCLDGSPDSKIQSSSNLASTSNLASSNLASTNLASSSNLPSRDALKHTPRNKDDNLPIPILPRGKNITAFQKPDWYAEYIGTLLKKHQNNGLPPFSANTPKERQKIGLPDFSENILTNLKNKQIVIKDSGWIHFLFSDFDVMKLTHFDNPLWDQTNKRFKLTLHDLSERALQSFLNTVIGHLKGIYSDPKTPSYHRLFDARTRNCPISRGSASRKPDICLVSKAIQESDHKLQWPLIDALVEVTSSSPQRRSQLGTVLEKSALMFESQPWRRFTVSLAFHGPAAKAKWFLILCDRAGVVTAGPFEFDGIGGMTLVRVLYVLAFGAPETIGADPTIDYDPITGEVTAIHVEHTSEESQTPVRRSFQPICLLHNATQLAGRATRAWLVKEDSQFYVLKDSWVLCSHPCSEIKTLRKINDTMKSSQEQEYLKHCYPILVAGQDLGDSTEIRRPVVTSLDSPRTHRRIVTGPVGDPLTSFRSKREFCSCIRDVVKCKTAHCLSFNFTHCFHPDLRFLNVKCNIIHGDISLNNLRINRVWPESTPSDPVGYGLTIDNDYSFEKHQTAHTTSVRPLNIKVDSSDIFVLGYSPIHVHCLAHKVTQFCPFGS